ncbi:MAG TPA: endonuclease/exonuclease/phosphatase family protein [archaeon]|nr:endonuclease/exonuclease/phosphatase family protein [archaeon]
MKVTLLQWNVWYEEKIKNIIKVIKELNPDIVCLQEIDLNSEHNDYKNVPEEIAKSLKYHHFYKPSMKFKNKKGWEFLGNGIYSKFPLLSQKMTYIQKPSGIDDYDKQGRIYIEAKIKLGKKLLTIGTVHVSYSHRFEITSRKIEEVDKLVKIIKKKQKMFILTGDMNSKPSSYTVKQLEKFLKNSGPNYTQKTWTTKPFDYKGFNETKLRWRLDYVFASKDIHVIKSKIIKTKFSDHLPILVEFEFI